MKTFRNILSILTVACAVALLAPGGAMATVTADIGGDEAGGAVNGGMSWDINYDDATRNIVATASGSGWCLVTVQLTNTITRIVEFVPLTGGTSQNPDIAGATPDFTVPADGQPHIIASGIAPNQVKRMLGKSTATVGGLNFTSEWSRI